MFVSPVRFLSTSTFEFLIHFFWCSESAVTDFACRPYSRPMMSKLAVNSNKTQQHVCFYFTLFQSLSIHDLYRYSTCTSGQGVDPVEAD